MESYQVDPKVPKARRARVILASILPVVLILLMLSLFGWWRFGANNDTNRSENIDTSVPVNMVDLGELLSSVPPTLQITDADQLVVNGELTANQAFVLPPGEEPTNPKAGQLYYDVDIGLFRFYDGEEFFNIPISNSELEICYVGDDCGFLTEADVELSTLPATTNVTSLTDNGVILGNGTGPIQATAAPTAGQVLVGSSGGVPIFRTISGDISMSSTGVVSLAANSVGASEITSSGVTAGTYGDGANYSIFTVDADGRITSASEAMLPGGGAGVGSLNSLSGALTIQGTTNQVIVTDDGVDTITLATPQDIAVTSSPTFVGLTLSGTLAANGSVSLGDGLADLVTISGTIQGGSPFTFEGAGANGFEVVLAIEDPTGDQTITLPDTAGVSDTICLETLANCAGTSVDTFSTINAPNGTDPVADSSTDTLNLTDGTNITVTGDSGTDTITIAVVANPTFTGLVTANGGLTVEAGDTFTMNGDGFTDLTGNGLAISTGILGLGNLSSNWSQAGAFDIVLDNASSELLIRGSGGAFYATLDVGALAGNETFNFAPGSAGDICTSAGNCVGGGGGSAPSGAEYVTLSLSGSLTAERVLQAGSGIDATDGGANGNITLDLAALTSNWNQTGAFDIVLNNASSELAILESAGGTFFGTLDVTNLSGDQVYTFPDATGNVCLSSGNCIGTGGGGAPNDASYITLGLDGDLSAERVLTPGSSLTVVDGGANGNYDINTIQDIRTTANPTFASPTFTGTLDVQGSSVTIGAAAQQGTLILNDGDGETVSLTINDIAASSSIVIPDAAGVSDTICLLSLNNCAGTATTLQIAYDNDANGSDATIALTTADDSIIIQNPASNGTDSSFVLTIDQLSTGAVGGLLISSAGSGNLLQVTDTTATSRDVFTIANTGSVIFRSQTDSTTGFQIQDSDGGTSILTVDTTNEELELGTATVMGVDGSAIFNEPGNSVDFRVEGDTDPNLLFVDGSADRIGINSAAPTARLLVSEDINSSGAGGGRTGVTFNLNDTGSTSSGTNTVRGLEVNVIRTNPGAAGGNLNVGGEVIDVSGATTGAGSVTSYGLSVAASGTSTNGGSAVSTTGLIVTASGNTTGTTTATGINVSVSGTDVLYSGVFTGGNFGIGTTQPGVLVDIDSETSTSDVDLFRIVTDVGSDENVKFRIDSDGDIFTDGSTTIGTPADVAEKYANYDGAVAGEVVVFLDNRTVGRSRSAYQTGIAGIVSTEPGLILSGSTSGVPVALAGRVPVKFSDENGSVKIGDYLTSSASRPGYAMKATKSGNVIGTAMEATSSDGIIDVWVNTGHFSPNNLQTCPVFKNINVTGSITTKNLTVTGSANIATANIKNLNVTGTGEFAQLIVNGHIISSGNQPETTKLQAAGTDGTVNIDGTDVAGTVTVVTGTSTQNGALAKVTFNQVYQQVPRINLTPVSADAAAAKYYVERTTNEFIIKLLNAPTANSNLVFDYQVIQ